MDIIYGDKIVPYSGTAVVLGDFDGLHAAHTKLVTKGLEYAKEKSLNCGVLLFKENTKSVLENTSIKLITTNEEKIKLLDNMGVDFVYMVDFDHKFMSKTPLEFVSYLSQKLMTKAAFVGYDYKFGYGACGNAATLSELGKKYGIETIVIPQMKIKGKTVSSTYIRNLICTGNVEEAALFLGRYFSIEGIVEKGFQNGRKLGFPTANVAYNRNMVLPGIGVYAGFTYVRGNKYKSVINVGKNPTFNADRITVESHILGFDADIYDENVRVSFIKRLRGDIKFSSLEALVEQIKKDAKTAENLLI